MAMTSKERMLRALAREKPDRLPASFHQWQPYHLQKYLGGIDDLEAFARFGLDAQCQYFGEVGQIQDESATLNVETSGWRIETRIVKSDPDDREIHRTIHTPSGDLSYKTRGNRQTTWVSEYLVKRSEDIEIIRKHMPVPALDLGRVSELYDRIGDAGILRGFVWGDQAGCWQHACCLMDVNELILRTYDDPGWVHEFLGILLEKKLRFIDTMAGAKFDLVETGGGAASSTVISPDLHREFCLPYDRRMHDALHGLGFRITYHTCGGTYGIEELIVANGCDASETLAPPSIGGNQEPWEFKRKIAGRLALIGGLDQHNVLTLGTPEEIRAKVLELFEKVGDAGGYILSTSDHFFETPLKKVRAYAEAARECTY